MLEVFARLDNDQRKKAEILLIVPGSRPGQKVCIAWSTCFNFLYVPIYYG